MNRKPFTLAACLAAVLGSSFALTEDEPLAVRDSVVAVVNKQVITQQDIMARCGPVLAEVDRDNSLSADERRARATEIEAVALRRLVDEKLLVAEGNRLLNADEGLKKRFGETVDMRLEEERRNAGGDAPLREALRKKGRTYQDYTDQLREQRLLEYVHWRFVERDLSVAPREILEYYQQHPNQFAEPAEAKFRGIFIPQTEEQSREAARKSAEELLLELKKPTDFALLAREHSSLHAEEGGLWDFTEQGTLPKPVDDLLFSLPVGEIGGPVETEMPGPVQGEKGFLIMKVEERRPARTQTFEEVQRPIEEMLRRRKQLTRYDALIRRLKAENYVEYVR
jgi:parvulin-like peptidyl-prolyl isomerase